ncbi:MAG: AbgT family transporter [Deltaproteobacteria bacterium]|nr:AbgT family transporter [Deltaproteobacteria bacterium]
MSETTAAPRKGWLGTIERIGNALPDPVFLFLYLVLALVAISLVASWLGWSVVHPSSRETVVATSLLAPANLQKLLVEMPTTFSHFHPLGYVLTVMLGAGVAERTGLFAAAMRLAVQGAPRMLLTPAVAFAAMMGNLAADAAYVVLVPLAGALFAAAKRHPVAGIVAAFAGVSGGFSANLVPGQLDALLFGITQSAAVTVQPGWQANIAGNWYFIAAMLAVFLPVIWWVTDKVVEPRLGKWEPAEGAAEEKSAASGPLTAAERKGLRAAAVATLLVVALWVLMVVGIGTPLYDEAAASEARLTPFYRSLVAGFLVLFLAAGWAYGAVAGTARGHRAIVKMMSESMAELAYYLVLAFAAAHFVAMFQWSNLGLIFAVNGAETLRATGAPAPVLVGGIVLLTALVNLFVGSASAKWALLAPVLVPMMMLLGISPEATTAVYRVGDSVTNIITPLMVYFPLVLAFCQRWIPGYGLGSLMASMIPYSGWLLLVGLALAVGWVALELPLGPDANVGWSAPPRPAR